MDLQQVNQRWRALNLPHATTIGAPPNPDAEAKYIPHCPLCDYTGPVARQLHGAMSEALVHKHQCAICGPAQVAG
jgi:hypothetical protein